MFDWSLNPYMGCVHRCTFCYVRAFERRADRPSDDRYGTSIRVKANVADVLRRELARPSWARECVAIGAATDPYQPAEGPLPADPRLHRGPRRGAHAVQHHHARPDDRPRRRRARRGRAPRERLGHVLDPDARRGRLAQDGAVDRPSAPAPPCGREARRSRNQDRRRHGARPPGHLRSPRAAARGRDEPRARPAQPASGRTCSSCAPARASISSSTSPRTGPSSCPATASCTETAPISRPTKPSPCAARFRPGPGAGRRRPPDPSGRAGPRARAACPRSLTARIQSPGRARTRQRRRKIRDHLPDRRRPRGRARRPAAVALARTAHPRDRRGLGRRQRRRPRGAAQAGRRDHGRPHARDGRARGDEAAQREGPGHGRPHLHRVQRAQPPGPRPRVGREGLHPQGGAAPDAAAGDRKGRTPARGTSTRR